MTTQLKLEILDSPLNKRYVVLEMSYANCYGGFRYRGNRPFEIAAVEVINNQKTDHIFHAYINPEMDISDIMVEETGVSNELIKKQPKFSEIFNDLINFIGDATIVTLNSYYLMSQLDDELDLMNADPHIGKAWGKHVFKILDIFQIHSYLKDCGDMVTFNQLENAMNNSYSKGHSYALSHANYLAEILLSTPGPLRLITLSWAVH